MAIDNKGLKAANKAKADEFYTQYDEIQREINAYLEYNPNVFKDKIILLPCDDPEWSNFTKFFAQNFERFGLKKLISTSYANDKKSSVMVQLSLFESESPKFDINKTNSHGKIFILDSDENHSGNININDLKWDYLNGDGDFRSNEVKKLRDEADIIITNPPFSLFREFVNWIIEAKKDFLIIGNQNAITYKEIFPLIKNNKMWTGNRFNQRVNGKNMTFLVPDSYEMKGTELYRDKNGKKYISVAGTGWFTNLEHGRRHQPLQLMTMKDNLKFSKHKEILERGYPKYDNYDAIEVSYTDSIPKDYKGTMGVPISFLNKYNPEQFKIIGLTTSGNNFEKDLRTKIYINAKQYDNFGNCKSGNKVNDGPILLHKEPFGKTYYTADNAEGYLEILYARILIEHINLD